MVIIASEDIEWLDEDCVYTTGLLCTATAHYTIFRPDSYSGQ